MRIKHTLYTITMLLLIIGMSLAPANAALNAVGPVDALSPPSNGFPLWYQDTNLLKLDLCLDQNEFCLLELPAPTSPVSFPTNFGPEAFWWLGEAAMAFPGGDGLLVLALEAAFANEVAAVNDQVSFGRLRIRINVDQPGTYVITHPFGTFTQVITLAEIGPAPEINDTVDVGNFLDPGPLGDVTLALGSTVGPFLYWDSGLPLTDPGTPGAFYIGNPLVNHTVLGSPLGTNFFRIEKDGVIVAETNLFAVSGKVSIGDGNTAPTIEPDTGLTAMDTPVFIDVLANDLAIDIPINPTSIAITNGLDGTAATEVVNGKVMVKFTPDPGFTGETSFTYTAATFTGTQALAATTVNITVEELTLTRAVLRTKLMKWQLQGTSSDTTANEIIALLGTPSLSTNLSGAQEVPAVITNASGTASVALNETLTQLSFTLNVQDILNITAAHIHVGALGADGPPIFNLSLTDFASPLTGILTAADLQIQTAAGIATFDDALEALLSGNTYINVHTTPNPGGEIRGQLGPVRIIGIAPVAANGAWSINGFAPVRPDESGTITIRSSNGTQLNPLPVDLR